MPYRLGTHSRRELEGVHPHMVAVVELAMDTTEQDFTVHDGLRTVEEQREYVHKGVSWTMRSKHLPQEDGLGHAVDLVPYINGRLRWEWPPIYVVFEAVRAAAETLDVPLIWGGCWHTVTGTTMPAKELVRRYVDERRAQGRRVTLDGPHFELKLR